MGPYPRSPYKKAEEKADKRSGLRFISRLGVRICQFSLTNSEDCPVSWRTGISIVDYLRYLYTIDSRVSFVHNDCGQRHLQHSAALF